MAKPKVNSLQQKLGFFDDDLKNPDHDAILLWVDKNIDKVIESIYNSRNWNAGDVEKLKRKAIEISKKEYETENSELIKKEGILDILKIRKSELEKKLKKETEKEITEVKPGGISFLPSSSTKDSIVEIEKKIQEHLAEVDKIKKKIEYLETFEGLSNDLPERKPPRITQIKWEYTVTSQSFNSITGYQSSKSVIGFIDMRVDFVYTRLIISGLDMEREKITQELQWSQTEKRNDNENDLLKRIMFIEVKTKIPSLGELFRQLNTYRAFASGDYIVICPDDSNREVIENQGFYFYKYEEK